MAGLATPLSVGKLLNGRTGASLVDSGKDLANLLKARGEKTGTRMVNRALSRGAHRWGVASRAFESGGWRGAWGAVGGPVSKGAAYGAAIGAGLNAGMALIDDANNRQFGSQSIGHALGAGIKGGLLGGALGGLGGLGNSFLGPASRTAKVARRASAAVPASWISRMRNAMRYSGTGFDTQTPTFARAARALNTRTGRTLAGAYGAALGLGTGAGATMGRLAQTHPGMVGHALANLGVGAGHLAAGAAVPAGLVGGVGFMARQGVRGSGRRLSTAARNVLRNARPAIPAARGGVSNIRGRAWNARAQAARSYYQGGGPFAAQMDAVRSRTRDTLRGPGRMGGM